VLHTVTKSDTVATISCYANAMFLLQVSEYVYGKPSLEFSDAVYSAVFGG